MSLLAAHFNGTVDTSENTIPLGGTTSSIVLQCATAGEEIFVRLDSGTDFFTLKPFEPVTVFVNVTEIVIKGSSSLVNYEVIAVLET